MHSFVFYGCQEAFSLGESSWFREFCARGKGRIIILILLPVCWMTPGELFNLFMCQHRNGMRSDMSQYVFCGIASKRIVINNSYSACITEHFCFLSLGQKSWHRLTLYTWHKTLGSLKLYGVNKKQQTPVICIVLYAEWFIKHFHISSQLILTPPVKRN